MLRSFLLLTLAVLASASATAQSAPPLTVEPYLFEAGDGRSVEAELGRFHVPENRARADGRTLELAFVRFPSTSPTPGPPIVYLAGGPGGSGIGTARGTRFDLFQSLREVADVIAFDQRGTGLSEGPPECPHQVTLSLDATPREAVAAAYADAARACLAHWRRLGVDLGAYNTEESADDLDALREALGADQISLWAISFCVPASQPTGSSCLLSRPSLIIRIFSPTGWQEGTRAACWPALVCYNGYQSNVYRLNTIAHPSRLLYYLIVRLFAIYPDCLSSKLPVQYSSLPVKRLICSAYS